MTQVASKMASADPVVMGGWAGTRMIQALQGVEVGGDSTEDPELQSPGTGADTGGQGSLPPLRTFPQPHWRGLGVRYLL